jgi:predicted O-methyltransferase YrrM
VRYGVDISGWYTVEQGEHLAALAADVPGPVVEIGTHAGRSISWVLALTDKDAVCIDLWGDETFESFKELLRENGWTDRVTLMQGSSENAAQLWDGPIGLLHIDGGHDYENVLIDYTRWAHHVVPGGAIVFHDDEQDGPSRLIESEVKSHPDQWTDWKVIPGTSWLDGQFSARRAEAKKPRVNANARNR